MKKDSLGDRIKFYESFTTSAKLMHNIPIIVRLDGCAFHNFTKGLNRPYDENLSKLMIETTKYLCSETNAKIGYTQSDEITLILFTDSFESKILFDAKLFKLTSVLASKCSTFFNSKLSEYLPSKKDKMPVFDCRIFNVPSKAEAANTLLWRKKDAIRNSISMAAQSNFSHKDLQNKSSRDMLSMLEQKNIIWENYPSFFKWGTFVKKHTLKFKASLIHSLIDLKCEYNTFVDTKEKFITFSDKSNSCIYLGLKEDGTVFTTNKQGESIVYFSSDSIQYKLCDIIIEYINNFKTLPEKHSLKSNSDLLFERSFYSTCNIDEISEEIFN